MKLTYVSVAFGFMIGILSAQEKVKIDGVATVIGKNIVLDSEVEAFKLELLQQSDGKSDISDCEMLEQIMNRKLLAHHAVIDSIVVSEAEISANVQRKVSYFSQQLGSPEKMLEYYGFDSMKDLNAELADVEREAMYINKMQQKLTSEIDITPEEVKRYYKSLEESGNLPEFGADIELAQIVINVNPSPEEEARILARLNEIRDQVINGESFSMKAILYSDDPGVSQNSGLYTITRQSPFVKEFKEAAFSLDEGEISEPFKSDFGYHILIVEKVKGKERDVRHLLLQPEIDQKELDQAKDSLTKIREDILKQKITFEEAVLKYTDDKDTKLNKGFLINPMSSDTHFELTRMDPELYARVSNLKPGEFSEVFYDETQQQQKMYKFLVLKSKTESHVADLSRDYVKIKDLALQKKKAEAVDKWATEKIVDTYIKINDKYEGCTFEGNWRKL
ncbi:peptidylprolyl isomerase [Namhaeicola litoreus]|uniref:Peptidylprolyl isomerase n=1 Tax=Namhaeicola litoreus TaxID=1052145 RepID=A0ABW3Y6Y6_9FLAO